MDLEKLLIESAISTESGHKVVSLEKALDYMKRAKVAGIKLVLNFTYLDTKDPKVLAAMEHISTTLESILNVPVLEPVRLRAREITDVPGVPIPMDTFTPLPPKRNNAVGATFELARFIKTFNGVETGKVISKFDLIRLAGEVGTDIQLKRSASGKLNTIISNYVAQMVYQGYVVRRNTVTTKGLIARVKEIPLDMKFVVMKKKPEEDGSN